MSTPINDGGPAFPVQIDTVAHYTESSGEVGGIATVVKHSGMSLRDWFAGQALAGLLASHRQGDNWPGKPAARQGVEPQHVIARGAYDIADAMLAAREEAL